MIEFSAYGNAYRITADRYQWILSQRKVNAKSGEERWEPISYQPHPQGLAQRLALLGAAAVVDDIVAGVNAMETSLRELLPARVPRPGWGK